MCNLSIPEVSREEVIKRYKTIKPLITIGGIKYHMREFTDDELFNISYTWEAQKDKTNAVDKNEYVALIDGKFECLHAYSYYGFFKPSIAEVLSQLTESNLYVNAFEIISSPQTASDFAKHKIQFDNGYHVSMVQLYVKKS